MRKVEAGSIYSTTGVPLRETVMPFPSTRMSKSNHSFVFTIDLVKFLTESKLPVLVHHSELSRSLLSATLYPVSGLSEWKAIKPLPLPFILALTLR